MSGSKSSAPDAPGAEPLGLTVHGLPTPALPADAQQRRGRLKMLLILGVCALPVLASYFMVYIVGATGVTTNYSALIQPSAALPPVDARLPDGRSLALPSLKGQWLLVVVGSGACDAACEQRLYLQRQLREMTGRERDRIDKLWLVIDDAPIAAPLQAALAAAPATLVLRLPRATVAAWLKPAAGQALEDHLYVVDPMGEWMMRAPPQPEPAKLKRDLDRLLRASASWDQAGR
ncbi:hypothetical protein HLB44_07245 [Aquincola sp. S2]|uniref:Transmembrane protein n=1 Tax=Pseudaquabacterium terrae TaxID=2732868 RepID=A0ABX2EDT4_9BURK|nr:hypothetical protein [Aquabacterium terrae]NRF66773.1 hypothetical protein [Aquabacterium terrae]